MASKRRNVFYQNRKQETTEICHPFVECFPRSHRDTTAVPHLAKERCLQLLFPLLCPISSCGHPPGERTMEDCRVTVILDEDVDYSSLSSGEPLSYTSLEEFSQSVLYDSDLESLESEDSDPKGMVNFGETLTNMKAAAEAEEEKAFMPSQKSGGEAEPGELELLPRRSYPRLPWDEDQDVVGITELVKAFGQAKEDTSVKNVLEVRKSIRTSTAGTSSPGLDDETILAKCPSEIMDESDALALQELNASLTYRAATEGELNLRKFRVLGGVYYVDLTEQPPQEYVLKDRSKVKLLFGPYALRRKEFAVEYRPPAVVESEDKDDT
ncbi:hypothetical protein AAG570_007299 [Ranatra chinensis]|uniref:Uncharacterized protein n=1 Tax=Ranatra chinensis TaxID=642074 RepID=A0ABD0XVR9_9HEMI